MASAKKSAAKSPQKPAAKSGTKSGAAPVPSTGFWLMKSEPESYSIDAFQQDKKTLWTGVRNYQARNFMMTSMRPGDRMLFYHSNAEPSAVVGEGRIARVNLPDPTALDPKSDYYDAKASTDHPIWFCAEVEFTSKLAHPVSLELIRQTKALGEMALLRPGQRLSILPLTHLEYELLVKMGQKNDQKNGRSR